ncbi:hypothetical protein BSL78_23911 [Apostichopus japonicus]|uniref:Uncharacterized protein n=1 Tax=Stichopus japonicus TaxID=307972 RepID=A0A2G8JU12_STIJA|nr:hypothetical protein BSL78_23911 [Apostichopus japonicus]
MIVTTCVLNQGLIKATPAAGRYVAIIYQKLESIVPLITDHEFVAVQGTVIQYELLLAHKLEVIAAVCVVDHVQIPLGEPQPYLWYRGIDAYLFLAGGCSGEDRKPAQSRKDIPTGSDLDEKIIFNYYYYYYHYYYYSLAEKQGGLGGFNPPLFEEGGWPTQSTPLVFASNVLL